MKHKLFYALGLVILMAVAFAASANAQTIAAGPYYATPSWDQKLQCDTQATCPRFIVLSNWNNEAVLDRETGLVWEKSPQTGQGAGNDAVDWTTARGICLNRNSGGRAGWRLPSMQELASLLDFSVPFPGLKLPAGHPFANVVGFFTFYWSATTDTDVPTGAWGVSFGIRAGVGTEIKGIPGFVWCVRGGGLLDNY